MSRESTFIDSLKGAAWHDAARGLVDDAAVLEICDARIVITQDIIVQGIHYLLNDPPADVAWKLVAVNLSDLAAKGARPVGVFLGYMLGNDDWDFAFSKGLSETLSAFAIPLLGGDTVSSPAAGGRTLSLTAIGEATSKVPSRADAVPGDLIWVSGSIGDAGAGLRLLQSSGASEGPLVERYRLPRPRLELGQRLAPLVNAMMDVSDGLLIDIQKLVEASGAGADIELKDVPLSPAFLKAIGDSAQDRLFAATAGDDYELLFTAPPDLAGDILRIEESLQIPLTRIGRITAERGLSLAHDGESVPLPAHLGYEHGKSSP